MSDTEKSLSDAPVRLGVLVGSTRPGRIGGRITEWLIAQVPDGFDVQLLDLAEIGLPFLDEPRIPALGDYAHEHTLRWAETVVALQAMVMVVPEYNRGYAAPVKNALDFLYAEWAGLPVAQVGYGWGGALTARAHLDTVLSRVKMPLVDGVGLAFEQTVSAEGEVTADEALLGEVARMFESLRAAARP